MSRTAVVRTASTHPRPRPTAVGLVVVTAMIVGILVCQSASFWSPSSAEATHADHVDRTPEADGAVTVDDGVLPDRVTIFDDQYPGVADLDPDLLRAVREAATDAAVDGIKLYVNSGWRSPEYQDQLLRAAISEYGSEDQAVRWVATADTSPHVSGDAIDIGHSDATAWLSEHGAGYGLCQIYGNEPWHYELRPRAIDRGCPPLYPDPTHDPRMQQ